MAQSAVPKWVLLEDAIDLCDFFEAPGRAIPRDRWVDAYVAAARQARMQAAIERMIG
jgi:hypothetical protein